ncbi:hypothetical protein [Okeania sp. KiyG1]|nr:hypothetical protein [Okeania sp. KiyG1]
MKIVKQCEKEVSSDRKNKTKQDLRITTTYSRGEWHSPYNWCIVSHFA